MRHRDKKVSKRRWKYGTSRLAHHSKMQYLQNAIRQSAIKCVPVFLGSELKRAILVSGFVSCFAVVIVVLRCKVRSGWEWGGRRAWLRWLLKEGPSKTSVLLSDPPSPSFSSKVPDLITYVCLAVFFHIIHLLFSFLWLLLMMWLRKLEPWDTEACELVSVWKLYKDFRAESLSFLCAECFYCLY